MGEAFHHGGAEVTAVSFCTPHEIAQHYRLQIAQHAGLAQLFEHTIDAIAALAMSSKSKIPEGRRCSGVPRALCSTVRLPPQTRLSMRCRRRAAAFSARGS